MLGVRRSGIAGQLPFELGGFHHGHIGAIQFPDQLQAVRLYILFSSQVS